MSRVRFAALMSLLLVLATPALADTAGADAVAVRSTRIHLPGPGYVVRYYCFSKFCPQGTPCEQGSIPAEADSTVSVPQLLYLGDGLYVRYDQINIQFVPENGAGHIVDQDNLAPPLVLRPAERVADRALDYAPVCNPYWVETLEELRLAKQFLTARYGFSSGSMAVKLQTDPAKGPSYSQSSDEINWPADPAWFDYENVSMSYAIGHEFTHHMQSLAGHPVGNGASGYHESCYPRSSAESAFGEGMADAIGGEYNLWRRGWDPNTDFTPCWKLTYFYEKDEVIGLNYEGNNAALWRSLSKRNAPALWHRFTHARIALATGTTRPIRDGNELLMALTNADILPDRWIANPEPTSFPEADSLFQYWVNGVEPVIVATGASDPNNAGGWENDPDVWMRSIYPNPAPGNFSIAVRAPSSGAIGIDLYDVHGRLVHSQTFTGLPIGEHTLTITPSKNLPSGKYFVRYTDRARHLVTSSKQVTIVK